MNHMQDLEEKIMNCWNVVDDIEALSADRRIKDDRVMNVLIGMAELYQVKFENLWNTYEVALREYYAPRK